MRTWRILNIVFVHEQSCRNKTSNLKYETPWCLTGRPVDRLLDPVVSLIGRVTWSHSEVGLCLSAMWLAADQSYIFHLSPGVRWDFKCSVSAVGLLFFTCCKYSDYILDYSYDSLMWTCGHFPEKFSIIMFLFEEFVLLSCLSLVCSDMSFWDWY